MPDGLNAQARALIQEALSRVPEIRSVVLFGSRALGTFKPGSDIDLALEGEGLTPQHLARLAGLLDELPLPYRFDLTLLSAITNPALREHLDQVGILFWERGALPHQECDSGSSIP